MSEQRRARVVGLTGGLASGKSTVGRLLRELGAEVVDADEVARAVVEPGQPAYQRLIEAFGEEVLEPTGGPPGSGNRRIDRARLAARVFGDEEARRRLNGITHPEIADESARRILAALARGAPLVVYEAALLVENERYRDLDGLIVVDVPEEVQVERAMRRSGLTRAQAEARLLAQASREARLRAATWVIDNSGPEAALRPQVEQIFAELRAS